MTGTLALSFDEYHADPAEQPSLTASIARILCTASPRHAWTAHPRLNPDFERPDDPKFDIGTAAHALLLQGIDLVHIIHAPDWRTAAAKEERDIARTHGRIPLLATQWDDVRRMVETVQTQLGALDVQPTPLTDGKPEQTLMWDEDGVACRCRFDWLRDDLTAVDDLKTTSRSANPRAWAKSSLTGIGADIQAAFYLRGLERAFGATDVQWRWVVTETYPPYALSVITPGPDVLTLANAKVDHALAIWRRCLATGEWPSYPTTLFRAELPPWAEVAWFENSEHAEVAA